MDQMDGLLIEASHVWIHTSIPMLTLTELGIIGQY